MSHFRYAKLIPDSFIPFTIPKWYAQEFLYSNYDTTFLVNDEKELEKLPSETMKLKI